jgi:hypothetical protein
VDEQADALLARDASGWPDFGRRRGRRASTHRGVAPRRLAYGTSTCTAGLFPTSRHDPAGDEASLRDGGSWPRLVTDSTLAADRAPCQGPSVTPVRRLGLILGARMGIPRRTLDRRLAAARCSVGAAQTTEAIASARRLGWLDDGHEPRGT